MTARDFIAKWRASTLKERSASQSHFNDLCALVGHPTPVEADPTGESFTFERGATKTGGGEGWADVWKKGHFAWEYKGKHKDLSAAFTQLQRYAIALENPPLLVVSDMETISIHTNFTNTVEEIHTLALEDLERPQGLEKLRWLLTEPERLRPGVTRRMVTEQAAQTFAALAQTLREAGHESHRVAHFVNKLIFCMFAEDSRLLPNHLFTRMVESVRTRHEKFAEKAALLFAAMRDGGEIGFGDLVPWFNGGLFDDDDALPLSADGIAQLLACAKLDWSDIEPAIFGTLFERGLDPSKRSQLGAHYTDRDSIMRIVGPVVIEPLEHRWQQSKTEIAAALDKGTAPARRKAAELYRDCLAHLRATRVLDPACGSGNFLYLALIELKNLEHRIMLEGEVFGFQRDFPQVGPHNVLGIEINDYAAELARVTVWIGDLQWSIKNGQGYGTNPILKKLDTIQCRDALINADGSEAVWPQADCIVGNPPFLGDKKMLAELGDEYVGRLRKLFKGRVPGGADLVTYWFEKARAAMTTPQPPPESGGGGQQGRGVRAGLVATNSVRGGANREVLKRICQSGRIFTAWSDEPWINEGAAVRVSLICFTTPLPPGEGPGVRAHGPRTKERTLETTRHDIPAELLEFSRQLRKTQTDAENLLWALLRNRQMDGCKFRRQHPISPYILDFYCHEAQLCIELDGAHHGEQQDRDRNRDQALAELGIKTLRFWNNQALRETEAVAQAIWNELQQRKADKAPSPLPSPRGRGGEKLPGSPVEVRLNGRPVSAIYADLTAGNGDDAVDFDLTEAKSLKENEGVAFQGPTKGGAFDIPGDLARQWLLQPNPHGKSNSDVVKPWANGQALTGRWPDMWIIDFDEMGEEQAALFEAPFAHVLGMVKPEREKVSRERRRKLWWQYNETAPGMRTAIAGLNRYIATPEVSKHRLFVWLPAGVAPDKNLVVIARDDDTTFGILHSRFHELWALRMGTSLEDRPRYTSSTTFRSFPFPPGLEPALTRPSGTLSQGERGTTAPDFAPPSPSGRGVGGEGASPHAQAIAAAARRLVELRENWLNPAEWVERVPETIPPLLPGEGPGVRAYPDRILPRPGCEKDLAKRTLTNLYNLRPQWLANAHAALDAAVAAAYGWPADLADDEILARLLGLNRERSGVGGK